MFIARKLVLAGALIVCFNLGIAGALAASSQPFDHSAFDAFLKEFVTPSGAIDFQGIKDNLPKLEPYFQQIQKAESEGRITEWPREEQIAFWMNVYHAALLRELAAHYPLKSIQDIPGVWDKDIVMMGTLGHSLNDIWTQKLMSGFRSEKIVTSLYCGAVSCPRLKQEAFTGPKLEGQLFMATREFVNNPRYVTIEIGNKDIHLSSLFKWHAQHFRLNFGPSSPDVQKISPDQFAVLSFLAFYLEDAEKVRYLEEGKYKIRYHHFNWKLNDIDRKKE